MAETLHELIESTAARDDAAPALCYKQDSLAYGELADSVERLAGGLRCTGVERNDRVAIYAEKRIESVITIFATSKTGAIFVPVNPLLRPKQVAYILNDCAVRLLVTTRTRLAQLADVLPDCPNLTHVAVIDGASERSRDINVDVVDFDQLSMAGNESPLPTAISSDVASIFYTSGSTGRPKGVVLSHRNLVIGAKSVAEYLGNGPHDRILSALPFSFDAGFSQLTTGFSSGATVYLHNHLLARDIVRIVEEKRITGITGVPPLWMQISDQNWPAGSADSVRYFANTGGSMPRKTLTRLQSIFERAEPFLMYGLTEAFRSTYLPPSEVENRPDSIGKSIPNAEVMVVRPDGTPCAPGEVGELVHRGPLVALGYWNDPEKTAERFKPSPGGLNELPNAELAVWSGDFARVDDDGFLYFVSRMDEMIKTSGYRVSPSEIEEIVFDTGLVSEAAAVGAPHPSLGQAIVLIAKAADGNAESTDDLLGKIRPQVPNYMIPTMVRWMDSLPRNANGKIDRVHLRDSLAEQFADDDRK